MQSAGRIRTLADALRDFTPEVRALREALSGADLAKLSPDAKAIVSRGVAALEDFNRKIGQTNVVLQNLSQRPIMASLMGNSAEGELQKLAVAIEALRREVQEAARVVSS